MSNFYEEHHLDAEDLTYLQYFVRSAIRDEEVLACNATHGEIIHDNILRELRCLEHKLAILYHHEVEVYHNG